MDVEEGIEPGDTVVIVESPEEVIEDGEMEPVEVDSGDTIVTIDNGGDDSGFNAVEFVERLVKLEGAVEGVIQRLLEVEMREIVDAVESESDTEVIAEAVEDVEEEVEELREDVAPESAKVHALFRPAKDWFGK